MTCGECLKKVRISIESKNYAMLENRSKLRITLAQLGLTNDDALDDIYNLTENDFNSCEDDKDSRYNGTIWKFKKRLHSKDIYIKLKFKEENNNQLLIISYHLDGML